MTGDSHSNDDADFLDEDFVIEDLVGKNDDLEDLFDEPAVPAGESAPEEQATTDGSDEEAAEQAPAEPDEDDMLFTDHTEGVEASEEFQKPVFAEDGANEWDGQHLDLESVGVPDATEESEELAADPQVDEAKESFAAELDSLLNEEEDFALDSEADLELVNMGSEVDDGISEFEQSGPFVIDDGDGLWEEELEETEDTGGVAPTEVHADVDDADDVVELPAEDAPAEALEQPTLEEAAEAAPASQAPTYEELMQQQAAASAGDGFEQLELGRNDDDVEDEGITLVSADGQMMADALAEADAIGADGGAPDNEVELEDEGMETMPLLDASVFGGDAQPGEAGWEPLPATSMDELSEVDEVQRTDEDAVADEQEYDVSGYEEDEEESTDEQAYEGDEAYEEEYTAEADLDDVEGHDIYAEEGNDKRGVVLGGPGSRRSTASLLLSVAASLLVLFGAGAVIVRPEWFGLSVEPERVAKVDVARPKVEVAVVEPPKVALANEILTEPDPVDGTPPTAGNPLAGGPEEGAPETGNPDPGAPESGNPEAGNPVAGNPASGSPETGAAQAGQPEDGTPETGTPENGNPEAGNPVAGNPAVGNPAGQPTQPANPTVGIEGAEPTEVGSTQPPEVVASNGEADPNTVGLPTEVVEAPDGGAQGVPSAGDNGGNSWPVAQASKEPTKSERKQGLTRFGDDLMVGGVATGIAGAKAMDGVMPGSRAFAQLHNGNYFIGKVKHVADEAITLRVETGEVTLATAEIAQLTRLGTTDYDELQKATKGFVRLTNNNRLVGGILSRIADDHIVLEFRSNRVMLPKSAIGEIVSGKSSDGKIRLGTTSEEDSWIRSLAERELGTGQGAPVTPTAPVNPAAPVRSGPPR